MTSDRISISNAAGQQTVLDADYSDDDIVIIDNIRLLAEPSSARLKMNIIVICTRGQARFDLNGNTLQVTENQLLLATPGSTFANFMISPDFEFKVVFLTGRIMLNFLREKMNIWNEVLYINKMHVVAMDRRDVEYFTHFYHMVRLCIDDTSQRSFKAEILQSVLRSGILGLCGVLKMGLDSDKPHERNSAASIFRQFLDLLTGTAVKHRPVGYYAQRLCVTPKYLSSVCKRSSGKTAGQWITEHVLEDARYYLRSTDMSIKEVCNTLGFPNASFFGKFIKQHYGMTPARLRSTSTV